MTVGLLGGFAVMLCWGIADFLQSIVIRRIGTPKTMVVRNLFTLTISICLGGYLFTSGTFRIDPFALGVIVMSSFSYVLGYFAYMRGFEVGSVSVIAPIASSYSLVTVVLSVVILGEGLPLSAVTAIAAIIVGAFLTASDLRKLRHLHRQKGLKEALATMVGFGIAFFILGFASKDAPFISIMFYSSLTQAIFFIALGLMAGGWISQTDFSGNTPLVFLVHAILVNLGWLAYIVGTSQANVSIVAPISSVFSAVTVLLALAVYRESIVLNQKAGIVVALFGILLLNATR